MLKKHFLIILFALFLLPKQTDIFIKENPYLKGLQFVATSSNRQ